MKLIFLYIAFIVSTTMALAQGVGINTGATVADPSAELEIKSTTRGILVPSLANTAAVTNPATGLIIYNQSCNCFSYHVGSGVWIDFPASNIKTLSDKDADTKIYAEKNLDEDKLRFTSGMGTNTETEVAILDNLGLDLSLGAAAYKFKKEPVLKQNATVSTVSAGGNAGKANTTGSSNTFVGRDAGLINSTGSNNVIAGWKAGVTSNASDNVLIGRSTGKAISSGGTNTVVGDSSLVANVTGTSNIAIGAATASTATASNNIVLGATSATSLTTGQNTITIGTSAAGSNTNGIINIGTIIRINPATPNVTFNNAYTFPTTAGSAGDILRLNASNQLLWASRMPRDVAGALADVQPFFESFASTAPANMLSINQTYFVKVMSFASASLSYIETYINNTGGGAANVMLGIYDGTTMQLLAYTNPAVTANFVGEVYDKLLDPTTNAITSISVDVSKTYYLGIYYPNTTAKFLKVTDTHNQSTTQAAPAGVHLDATITSTTTTPDAIWIHAF